MKYAIVLGTRPEIIKLASLIKYLEQEKQNYFVIHTGQHYSWELDGIFFQQLDLPSPKYKLNVSSHSHGKQTGLILDRTEEVFIQEKPDIVFVQGDTNSVCGGALAASKLNIPVAHIEAGLRSYDRSMPEEINRVITDHMSTYLFCPTIEAKENLKKEGITKEVSVVGNTVVDSLNTNINKINSEEVLSRLNVKKREYILVTVHRPENTDNTHKLREIMSTLKILAKETNNKIIYPAHPRTQKQLEKNKIEIGENIKMIAPLSYFDFLILQQNSKLILTDSGGVQEEACILKTPCVTMRNSTERPETLKLKSNILVSAKKEEILTACRLQIKNERNWTHPYGDGTTAEKIIKIITRKIKNTL